MYPSPQLVALRLAILLKRTGKTRTRVSRKTFELLSGRETIRVALLTDVFKELDDLDVVAVELDRGGFGLIAASALEGAPNATASRFMPEWRDLSEDDLWREFRPDENQGSEDEETD